MTNVRKAHRGAATYNSSHKMIYILVSRGLVTSLPGALRRPSSGNISLPYYSVSGLEILS